VSALSPVTLDEVDQRSALRRRVDTKYVMTRERLGELVGDVDGYDVLEIDGRRIFAYESVYFDTPDLRCFRDHVEGDRPRFKARTRYYPDTGTCFFEVKVKKGDDTTKRQCDYDVTDHGVLTDPAREFLRTALRDLLGEEPPGDMAAVLSTTYRRVTLSARDGGERTTMDLDVVLRAMDGRAVTLREELALVETKSERGEGDIDAALRAAGCDPASISKYRLGVGLLLADDPESAHQQGLRSCFA
jgi:hypothetical protein